MYQVGDLVKYENPFNRDADHDFDEPVSGTGIVLSIDPDFGTYVWILFDDNTSLNFHARDDELELIQRPDQ